MSKFLSALKAAQERATDAALDPFARIVALGDRDSLLSSNTDEILALIEGAIEEGHEPNGQPKTKCPVCTALAALDAKVPTKNEGVTT